MDGATARVLGTAAADALDRQVEEGLALVREQLARTVAERREAAAGWGAPCARLWDDLGEGIGGKLLRPRLVLAAYLGLGGARATDVVPVAAATEVLHTAMLVHDDLLDGDEVRRGGPNLAGRTRARLVGRVRDPRTADRQVQAAAVLAGDAGIAAAFRLVAAADLPAAVRVALVELFGTTVETTVGGELLDVVAELADPADVDTLLVAELKTAVYSTRLPLVAGALAAGAPPAQVEALGTVGRGLGIAYQLVDDVLGTLGDPAVTGKSALGDLRDGKRTLLVQLAWRHADADGRQVLAHAVGDRGLDELGAARVRAVLRETGAAERVRQAAREVADQALDLAAAAAPTPLAAYLDDLVGSFMDRER